MMNKRTGYTASKRWEPFMVGVVLFLVVVVGVNMLFAYLSVRSWTGMVTSDPYTKGLRFNRRIQAQQAQEALGWQVALQADLEAGRASPLVVQVVDAERHPVTDVTVMVRFFRPVHAGYDREQILQEVSPGHYHTAMRLPLPGLWEVRVAISRPHPPVSFRMVRRIHVKEQP